MHAAAVARRVGRLQATLVLAVDAFDDATADLWRERFGFRDAAPALPGEPAPRRPRLWIPLRRDDDQ